MKRVFSVLLCLCLLLCLLPVTAFAATQITALTITNLPTPMAGSKVSVSATVNTTGAELYSMDWYDHTEGRFLESTEYFAENHVYEVQLWVEAKSGYEFRTNGAKPNVTATVGGKTAKVTKAYEYQAWAMVMVSYTFEPCPKKEIRSVDIQLEGITNPGNGLRAEQGQYVPFSIQSGDEQVALYPQLHTRYFPYGFRWSNITKDTVAYDGDRFQGGCDYYVTIALKPRDSAYVFADDFTATIGGKSAQIKSLGETYAEISVEVTCIGTIPGGSINPVVSLPRDGNSPDYGLYYGSCEHIEYAAVSGWYDVESGTRLLTSEHQFHGGKQYRVEVVCTAAYAYQFQRDANDKMEYTPMLTGQKVDSYSFGYDSYRGRELITLVKTFTAPIPDHTHTVSDWQCDESAHKKYCTVCGESMGGGAHYGGTATCTQKAKCTVCGYGYGKLEDHKWSPGYHPVDASGHALQCANCKGYDTRKPHTPGPAATETEPQTCTDCGYILQPAKNHTHKLTKVPMAEPTCTKEGSMEYYKCDGCSVLFEDPEGKKELTRSTALPTVAHTPGSDWQWDENSHWQTCTQCKNQIEESKQPHEMQDGKCTVCGYQTGELVPDVTEPRETIPTEETEPVQTDPAVTEGTASDTEPTQIPATQPVSTSQNAEESSLLWLWIVLGVVAAAAVAVIFLLKKK